MRKIEEKIVKAIHYAMDNPNERFIKELSFRDKVTAHKDIIVYTLHSTDVVTIYRIAGRTKNVIGVNSGGWQTNTTKSRINAILHDIHSIGIAQSDYAWYWIVGKRLVSFHDDDLVYYSENTKKVEVIPGDIFGRPRYPDTGDEIREAKEAQNSESK